MEVACDELMGQARFGVTFGHGFPVLVGALGPKMVELGAARSDGLVLNWLTPQHAQETVALAHEIGRANGRTPYTVLYVRLSPYDALHTDAVNYDAMANYHQHFQRQGLQALKTLWLVRVYKATTLVMPDSNWLLGPKPGLTWCVSTLTD